MSKHWSEALKEMTGQTEITGDALMEYFNPLYLFLQKYNKVQREKEMVHVLQNYDKESSDMLNQLVHAEWNVATDVTNEEKQKELEEMTLKNANFSKEQHKEHFTDINLIDYENEDIKRQLKYLTNLGIDILSENDLQELTKTKNKMQEVYNTAKICPFNNQKCDLDKEGLSLDPGKFLSDLFFEYIFDRVFPRNK